jgi:hypothetical protein
LKKFEGVDHQMEMKEDEEKRREQERKGKRKKFIRK